MKLTNNPHELQRVTLDIVFKVRHVPFNESHARELLRNYLVPKGITLKDDDTIEV